MYTLPSFVDTFYRQIKLDNKGAAPLKCTLFSLSTILSSARFSDIACSKNGSPKIRSPKLPKTSENFQNRIRQIIWIQWKFGIYVVQGFSTFWYPRTPKSKLYPSAYPLIRIICPLLTPKSKILPKRASFEHFVNFAYPLLPSRVPQVENRWRSGKILGSERGSGLTFPPTPQWGD
jgi:hypothetical protein